MNKTELVAAIAESSDLSNADVTKLVTTFTDIVAKTLSDGGDVALPGFGTFTTSERAARTGRNPQTGEALEIAASTVPKFKPGKGLKDQVKAANK